jgi:hypothetical protein
MENQNGAHRGQSVDQKWPLYVGPKQTPKVRVVLVCGAILAIDGAKLENDGSVTAKGRANLAFLHT